MKKILMLLIGLLGINVGQARETVTIVYAFGAGDSIANYYRALVVEANRVQNKYVFVFDTKPGAGNALAARYVKNTPNTILGTSPAFFIRPALYPSESYNIEDFRSLLPQCESPIAVSSLKFQSWNDTIPNGKYTIGVSGLGVATHLVALQIQTKFPNMVIVPYRSTSDASLGLASGDIDFHVGFISQVESWNRADRKITVLGITGTNYSHGYPLLHTQGLPTILGEMDLATHMVAPKSMPNEKFLELRTILRQAENTISVREFYKFDKCVPLSGLLENQFDSWFQRQNQRYKKLAELVKLDK